MCTVVSVPAAPKHRLLGEGGDGTQHHLLAVGTLPAPVLAVSWAQTCDGILVSDAGGSENTALGSDERSSPAKLIQL